MAVVSWGMASLPRIPQPGRIPARNWPIRFPPVAKEGRPGQLALNFELDYAPALEELEGLGFAPIHRVRSIPHSRLEHLRPDDPDPGTEEFILWHHPAGVLVRTQSYTTRAGRDWMSGQEAPARIKLDDLYVYVEVDSGAGPELAHMAAVKVPGSGTSIKMLDGTERHLRSAGVANATSTSFREFLEACQAHGRLVPLEDWTGESRVHLPGEMLFPVLDPGPWRHRDFKEILSQNPGWLEQGRQALVQALPEGLRQAVRAPHPDPRGEPEEPEDPGLADPAPPRGRAQEWTRVELAHAQVAEALFLGGQRFPGPAARAQVRHWMEVALGYHAEDEANWRAWEEGPAGVSLATVLLFSSLHPPAYARLLRLIEKAPGPVLERWLTQPDAAGYVLGQRVLLHAFCAPLTVRNQAPEHAARLVKVIQALVDRAGADRIVLDTPLRSALGIWAQQSPAEGSVFITSLIENRQEVAAQVMMAFERMGVEWISPPRGRNYPNVLSDEDRVLAFFEHPLPETREEFCRIMAQRLEPAAQPFLDLLDARLRARVLLERLPPSSGSPPRPRI